MQALQVAAVAVQQPTEQQQQQQAGLAGQG